MSRIQWKPVMKKVLKTAGALLGLVVIVVWTSGVLRDRVAPGKLEGPAADPLPEDAVTVTARREQVPVNVSIPGTVHSERRINLSARLPAYVEAVNINAGYSVLEGDILVELDHREILKELAAAEAQFDQAETAYQRSKRLLETDATTVQAHEAAESAYKSAAANVERVNVMLSYTQVTSPLNGVVADRYIEAGDLAGAGQVLLSVYDPTRLRLEVPVPARLISHFPEGREVNVMLDQMPEVLKGTVTEVVSEFDPVTRTRRVKIRLEDVPETVLPGMYGQVHLAIDEHEAVLLPETALKRIGQLELVQVVRDGSLYRRLVRTGPRHDGQVEILSGLEGGETVLTNPAR